MDLSEVLERPAVPIAETDWGGGGERRSRNTARWEKVWTYRNIQCHPQTLWLWSIDPSTGRTVSSVLQTLPVLSNVLSSSRECELLVLTKSASGGTGSRHRNNSRSLEHNNRSPINAWRRSRPSHLSSRQLFVPRTLHRKHANCRYCCSPTRHT